MHFCSHWDPGFGKAELYKAYIEMQSAGALEGLQRWALC